MISRDFGLCNTFTNTGDLEALRHIRMSQSHLSQLLTTIKPSCRHSKISTSLLIMERRSDPKSHTWTSSVVSKIITTTHNMIEYRAGGNFHALMHEELLCYFSPYYTAAFKGGFSEANQGSTPKCECFHTKMSFRVCWRIIRGGRRSLPQRYNCRWASDKRQICYLLLMQRPRG